MLAPVVYINMKLKIKHRAPIVIAPQLCRLVATLYFGKNKTPIGAFTIFPFIFVRDESILNNENFIRHETIHLRQYIETLILGMLILGGLQYFYARVIRKMSKLDSYYFMSYEQEAHQNDEDPTYLSRRSFLASYKYLLPKNRRRITLVDGKRIIYPK